VASVAPANPVYVFNIAQSLLNTIKQVLVTSCTPLPAVCGDIKAYVSVGPPPVDCCPLLAVYWDGASRESIGSNPQCVAQNRLILNVEYWVCTPINNPLEQGCALLDEQAQIVYEHWWQAYFGTIVKLKDGAVPELDLCDGVDYGPMVPLGEPQAGCSGVRWSITVTL
jgi:hypothetical protein